MSNVDLPWRSDTTMAIPDWEALWKIAPDEADTQAQQAYWSATANGWVDVLCHGLGDGYVVSQSESFLLLSNLSQRQNDLTLRICERVNRHVLRVLEGSASDEGFGPTVVLVFGDHELYHRYTQNYGDSAAEIVSSGMFIDHGYGHFVTLGDSVDQIEPIVAHETPADDDDAHTSPRCWHATRCNVT